MKLPELAAASSFEHIVSQENPVHETAYLESFFWCQWKLRSSKPRYRTVSFLFVHPRAWLNYRNEEALAVTKDSTWPVSQRLETKLIKKWCQCIKTHLVFADERQAFRRWCLIPISQRESSLWIKQGFCSRKKHDSPPNRWCCLICFMLFEGNMSIPEPSTWEESTVAGPSSMGRKVARTPATGPDVKARGLATAGSPGTTNSNWIVIPFENGTLSHWKWGFNVWFSGGLSHFQVFFLSDFH
jgi:hypothetical protein